MANLDEADVAHLGDVAAHCGLGDWGGRPAVVVTGVCGKIEAELAGLAPEEAREFMAELGIAEPGTARLLRENYRLLGLISFFTVGKDEVRAWTIPQGLNAQRAAGVIHTDLEKGFIRAEVCRQEDLVALGSMPRCAKRGCSGSREGVHRGGRRRLPRALQHINRIRTARRREPNGLPNVQYGDPNRRSPGAAPARAVRGTAETFPAGAIQSVRRGQRRTS